MRVTLNGIVAADDDREIYEWFGYRAFSPEQVRQAIRDNPPGEELILEINSGGGSVMAGNEMYTVLRSAEGVRTCAEIQSLAASAASYLALGCDRVMISPVAQMMIHLPTTVTIGDRDEHAGSVQLLDTIRDSILNAYELKSKGKTSRAELKRLMEATTWMTAQEARDAGLVDGILFEESMLQDPDPSVVVNAVGAGIRALGESAGVPDIVQLRAEYRRMNPAQTGGVPGANNAQDWQVQARLDLEKIRF